MIEKRYAAYIVDGLDEFNIRRASIHRILRQSTASHSRLGFGQWVERLFLLRPAGRIRAAPLRRLRVQAPACKTLHEIDAIRSACHPTQSEAGHRWQVGQNRFGRDCAASRDHGKGRA
jgi:hypothetical protein